MGLQSNACRGALLYKTLDKSGRPIDLPTDDDGDYPSPLSLMPVGSYEPNNYGLFDMTGNLNEWCSDAWNVNAYLLHLNGMIPQAIEFAEWNGKRLSFRVVRGGGVVHDENIARLSGKLKNADVDEQRGFLAYTIHVGERHGRNPIFYAGFRCVLDLDTWKVETWNMCPHPGNSE